MYSSGLGVEQLQQLEHEVLVDEALGDLGVDVVAHDEAEEKLGGVAAI